MGGALRLVDVEVRPINLGTEREESDDDEDA